MAWMALNWRHGSRVGGRSGNLPAQSSGTFSARAFCEPGASAHAPHSSKMHANGLRRN